jgi:hypothetical protein
MCSGLAELRSREEPAEGAMARDDESGQAIVPKCRPPEDVEEVEEVVDRESSRGQRAEWIRGAFGISMPCKLFVADKRWVGGGLRCRSNGRGRR